VARVPKSISEFTIVGKQKQALGISIESANVEEPFLSISNEVTDAFTTSVIGHGGHNSTRLIHRDDHQPWGRGDAFTIDVDDGADRIHPGAELGDRPTVHSDPALGDQRLRSTSTGNASLSQNLLEADAFVGTIHRSSP